MARMAKMLLLMVLMVLMDWMESHPIRAVFLYLEMVKMVKMESTAQAVAVAVDAVLMEVRYLVKMDLDQVVEAVAKEAKPAQEQLVVLEAVALLQFT